jgi:hypothetical protein
VSIRPVCVACEVFYRPLKNGIFLLEQIKTTSGRRPYKIWSADHWKCPGCGHEIVVGSGSKPVREDHAADFDEWREQTTVTVNG